jgi:hypothetical protein
MNFENYLEKNSVRLPWSGCQIWIAGVNPGGYAWSFVAYSRMGTPLVHRARIVQQYGKLSRNTYVCHSCDTPSCINVDHLFIGTPTDNARDRVVKGRSADKKGFANGRSTLTLEKLRLIRQLRKNGLFMKDIALQVGVHQSTVSHVCSGANWGDIS